MNRSYIEGMIYKIITNASSPNVWISDEYKVRDYRGTIEVRFSGFGDFCEFVNAVESRGWVATIKPDARRLLFQGFRSGRPGWNADRQRAIHARRSRQRAGLADPLCDDPV